MVYKCLHPTDLQGLQKTRWTAIPTPVSASVSKTVRNSVQRVHPSEHWSFLSALSRHGYPPMEQAACVEQSAQRSCFTKISRHKVCPADSSTAGWAWAEILYPTPVRCRTLHSQTLPEGEAANLESVLRAGRGGSTNP